MGIPVLCCLLFAIQQKGCTSLTCSTILWLKGNTDVVAPSSAPMLQMVPIPVAEMLSTPSPKYSTMLMVPPLTVKMPATFKMTSLGLVQPESFPVSLTPITLGHFNSQGMSAITSTASAPPTPMQRPPRPPPLGVLESVPTMRRPGKAQFSRIIWWMMPLPGFQNPTPYLAPEVARKL